MSDSPSIDPLRRTAPLQPPTFGAPVEKPKPADVPAPSFPALDPGSVALAKAQAFTTALSSKNDAFFEAASGPYVIKSPGGTTAAVHAAPQFRMVGGFNYHSTEVEVPGSKEKVTVCTDGPPLLHALRPVTPAMQHAVNRVIAGRGTPEDVRLLTQTLIDRGKLGPVDPAHAEEAIQAMQWKYGIGIDCAGYVQRAFFAARGMTGTPSERTALGLNPAAVNESFSNLPTNPKFKSVPVVAARAGDVLLLGPPGKGEVGHVVLVRSNTQLSSLEQAKLPKGMFTGPVLRLEVDSSWGAGEEGKHGGVQRRTWLYDAGTGLWASWDSKTQTASFSTTSGPYDHPLTGIYRPKAEP